MPTDPTIRRYRGTDEEACRGCIGVALLPEAERFAKNAGARELRIGVLSGNHATRHLYSREGFAPWLETLAKTLEP